MLRCNTKYLIAAFVFTSMVAPRAVRAQSNMQTTEITRLLNARYDAIAKSDTAALGRFLAMDLAWMGIANGGATLSRNDLLKLAAVPQVPTPRYEIDSVTVRRIGEVALVGYRRSDHRQIGSEKQTLVVHAEEVFSRRNGKWLLELHTQTWVMAPIKAIALDSATLAAFAGRYQIAPGFVDNVHWEGGHLVATATGEKVGAHLIPVSSSAFIPDGVAPLMVFERDASGKVVGYVQGSPNGEVRRAVRLP